MYHIIIKEQSINQRLDKLTTNKTHSNRKIILIPKILDEI
jgi:hypothetical protein